MPIPQFLKDFYYAIFNAYFRKPLSKFILIFLYLYSPVLKLKVATHIYIEPNIEDILYRHCAHSIINGLYNLVLVYSYLFCFIKLYIYIKVVKQKYGRILKGSCISDDEIFICLILSYEYCN